MYRQMAKWHQNVTDELHHLVRTSENTEHGLTDVNTDIKSIMKQLKHMETTAAAAAAAAAANSASTLGRTPPSVDDVLGGDVWGDDYDPRNFNDYDVDEDVDHIFEEFVEKVRNRQRMPLLLLFWWLLLLSSVSNAANVPGLHSIFL